MTKLIDNNLNNTFAQACSSENILKEKRGRDLSITKNTSDHLGKSNNFVYMK